MAFLSKLTSAGQVTLPKNIRDKVNMLPGDYVEINLDDEGRILLTPKKLIDASQAYYWTDSWQNCERKADEDIKAGRVKRFKSVADAIEHLKSRA
jgi:AbrB family looped-hinge helix DNA binding protein